MLKNFTQMVSYIQIVTKFFLLFWTSFLMAQPRIRVDTILMGSRFTFTVYHKDTCLAKTGIRAGINEVNRIENLISDWRPHTLVSAINRSYPNNWIKVNKEVLNMLQRSKNYTEISKGLFDITYAGMERIWKFDGNMNRLPTLEQIAKAREAVGIHFIEIQGDSVRLSHPKAKISFGSIGKAYATERAARIMRKLGLKNILVNGSGDLFGLGHPPKKKGWEIGIQNPFNPSKVIKVIHLKNAALLTSGDYNKYALIDGKRYGHIINPKTGWPGTEFVSVSIQGPNAEIANFLSTTLMLMNVEQSKKLLRKYPGYRFWIVQNNGEIFQ